MFALKPRIEIVIRMIVIVVMLFSALAPTAANAYSFSEQSKPEIAKSIAHISGQLGASPLKAKVVSRADQPTETATPAVEATPTEPPISEISVAPVDSAGSPEQTESNTVEADLSSAWGTGIGSSFPQNGANILQFDSPYPDLFTGRASYSLPIWTPPGRNGMEPSLVLSYSSNTANGALGDIQAPWVGVGWKIDSLEIARKITNGNCNPCGNGEYGYQNEFLLLINGIGYELLPDGTTPGRYHTKAESFLYIQLHNDALGNNTPAAENASGEWWEVVQQNGTRLRLGWQAGSEQVAAMAGYPGEASGTWASLGYAGHATDVVALRWRVDLVTDTHGNQMSFVYSEENRAVAGMSATYDRASYVATITYTSHISENPNPGYSVVFVRESRAGRDIPQSPTDWDNWDTERLDRIEVKHGQNVVRTYDLGYDVRSYSDDGVSWETTVLTSVEVWAGNPSNPTVLPAVTFTYEDQENRANCGLDCQEWAYPRLDSVSNGWGSTMTYVYGRDDRPSTSWYNWRVESVEVTDGINAGSMKTTLGYGTPCYNDPSEGWCNASNIGELIGYDQISATAMDFDGTTPLAISLHKFHTDEQRAGREYETQSQDGLGTTLSKTLVTYTAVTTGFPTGVFFTYANSVDQLLQASGVLSQVNRTEYEYDTTTGNLTREKQFDGALALYRETQYEYVTNPSPSVWILNTVARRTLKDASGVPLATQEYGYDGDLPGISSPTVGELTLSRQFDGTHTIDTSYIYDAYGNLTDIHAYKDYGVDGSQPSGDHLIYSIGYDTALKTYPVSATNPIYDTQLDYDYGKGLPTSFTDANHNTTTTVYDGLGRPIEVQYPGYTRPNTKYTYPTPPVSAPFTFKAETWDETANVYRSAWQIMDGLGRLIQTQSPYETEGELTLTDVSYNALGQTLNTGLPRKVSGAGGTYFAPDWGSTPHNVTSYDALGRTSSVWYPDGSHEAYSYSGLRVAAIDRNGHQKVRESDAFGRLKQVEEYTGSSGAYTLYAMTTYAYDPRNLLKQITAAQSSPITIDYDGFGRKISMSDPDMGNWTYTNYDVFGNLGLQTDARGCTTAVTYDDLNRPLQKTFAGPGACATTPSVTYTYDSTTAGNQGVGHRTGMSDGSGSTSWFYNALGQPTNVTRTINSIAYPIDATFDAFNRPLTQDLPSGETLDFGYNAMGLLSSLSGTDTYLSQVHYEPSGQVANQQLGNGLLQQYCYEADTLRLSDIRVYSGERLGCETNPSSPKLNLSYTYQPNGNVSQMTDATQNETTTYTYDELDRLLSVSGPDNKNYAYNPNGNINSVTTTPTITATSTGYNHTCALTSKGGVKCWGRNTLGVLGDGTNTDRATPVDVIGLGSGVTAITTGGTHTCALTTGGGVKCWGGNGAGQLGDGTTTSRTTPVDVVGLTSGVIAISAGGYYTCALTSSGGAKCWGSNIEGQLGDGSFTDRLTPVDVSGLTSGVTTIAAGPSHTCAVTSSGGAKCWGFNYYGQLGDGTTRRRKAPVDVSGLANGVVSIDVGHAHTCVLMIGGGVRCWGNNSYGQLGDGTTTNHITPMDVNGLNIGVVAIALGLNHTCALTSSGSAKCWGENTDGQVGDGSLTNRLTPANVSGLASGVMSISAGGDAAYSHTCAVILNGGIKCWGSNSYGQLGNGTSSGYSTSPVDANFGVLNSYSYDGHAVTSLASGETYTYDENGNMIERLEGGQIYYQTFDAENRMVSVTVNGQTTQFVYDGDGNLVKKIKPGGSSTLYVGNVYEVDKSAGGVVTRTVTYYPAGGAMRIDGQVYYVLKDRLGSAYATTDTSGTVVGEMRYYAFGETRFSTGNMMTDRLYTGQRWIADLGIYHYNARFYSPTLGRFLSADTMMAGIANPQNLNRFSYVANNPLRYTDPTGHIACDDFNAMGGCYTAPGGGGSGFGGVGDRGDGGDGGDGGGTDTNGNGVPDVPDPNAVIPHPNHPCQYDNLVECTYTGGYWPSGDYTFTDEEWDAFTLAIYYDVSRQANTGEGFWTQEYDETGRRGSRLFVPFHTETYYRRTGYDTIFWNEGGGYTGNVCFERGDCWDRNDVNYVAQGMWSAAASEGPIGAVIVADVWKQNEYGHPASGEVKFWSAVGADIYTDYSIFGPWANQMLPY